MAGTREGGLKAAAKIRAKNPAHWSDIGAIGGSAKVEKGLAKMDVEKRKEIARKGGSSKREKDYGTADSTVSDPTER